VTSPPVITSAITANGTVGSAFSYQIAATNTPTSFGATGLPGGLSVNTTTGAISGTPTGAGGTSAVTLSATNGVGTGTATLTLTITGPPVITSATTANGVLGSAFTYQIAATNSPTSYGATGLPTGLSVNITTGVISGTSSGTGVSMVTVSAINNAGTGSTTLTLTVTAAPAISLVAHTVQAIAGVGNSATSPAINTTGATLLVILSNSFGGGTDGCASGNVRDSNSNTWKLIQIYATAGGSDRATCFWYAAAPTVGAGHTFTVSNSYYSVFFVSAWAGITTSSPLDVQTGNSNSSGSTVNTGSVTTTASSDLCLAGGNAYDTAITAWSLASPSQAMTTIDSELPVGGSHTGGIDGYYVLNTAGSISSTVTPTGASSDEIVGTIACFIASGGGVAPAPPVITSASTANGVVGSAFTYQIAATNSPTSYGATGLPAGLSVNTTTGAISGAPTAAGTSMVTISATNSFGTGNATLTLTIGAVPAITSITTTNGAVGSTFSYQITGTNAPTSYGATGLPGGLSVNTTTGAISGTPTAAGSSTVTLSAANSFGTGSATLTLTIGAFSVTPSTATLTLLQTQQFTSSASAVSWSVDGVVNGSAWSGTITSTGLYTPPASAGTHTVTATTSSTPPQSVNSTVYVTDYAGTFTYHNDNFRSGSNPNETVLTPANVNVNQFGMLFSYPLDGETLASPLYVPNVTIPGAGAHNVVYVATEHDSVYAFDADGLSGSPLWQVSFLSPGVTTIPAADAGQDDITPEIGITSTPVIDPASDTLYMVARTLEGSVYVQRLHALNITTGAETLGSPVVIQASVPGTGEGSQSGLVPFDSLWENQRAALLLSNGVIYIAWASHDDNQPWHGWVMGYNETNLQQVMVYNVSPDNYGGGVWQSGGGIATDSTGNLFFATGNGDFTANTGGADFGDSILKLSPGGSVIDYFTPYDQSVMAAQDLDLASAGPVVLVNQPGPNPHLLITAGKNGTVYVINRDNMGQFQSGNDSQIVQSLIGILPNGTASQGNFSAPVFFNNNIYFCAVQDALKAFQISNGLLSLGPISRSSTTFPGKGCSFAVSANGATNGIVWAVQDNYPYIGTLFAYDAGNLTNELYDSTQAGARDALGNAQKFSIPLVANGKVFVVSGAPPGGGSSQNMLTAYGLLP
jgi:hypothetical protein